MSQDILPLTKIGKHIRSIQKIIQENKLISNGFLEISDGFNEHNYYTGDYKKYDRGQ